MSISISVILVVASTSLFVNAHLLFTSVSEILENTATLASVSRIMRQDIHAATQDSLLAGNLILYERDAKRYVYVVNVNHQAIRDQQGGGTAVIGAHIKNLQVTASGEMVNVQVQLEDGNKIEFSAQLGGGMGS